MTSQLAPKSQLAPNRDFDNEVRSLRRPGRWISAIVLLVLLAALIQAVATNKNKGLSI